MRYYAAIEAGGTKFLAAIGDADGKILQQSSIPTETPERTMPRVLAFLREAHRQTPFEAIGIGCFGPLDLNPASPHYGSITSTPKTAWRGYNILHAVQAEWKVPVGFHTDVTGAALAEGRWGAARGLKDYAYITVGTGIGAGIVTHGQPISGALHPEMGHMLIPQLPEDAAFQGVCPYHRNCLEGLASGPALKTRWQVPSALNLEPEHPAWQREAHYLALACMNLTLTTSPQKIILGGGVMKQYHLFELIQKKLQMLMQGYIQHPCMQANIGTFIVPPQLQNQAGLCGGIALACLATNALT